MTTLASFARTVNPATDIITAYAAAPYVPTPVASSAPWVVIGSFTVPVAVTGRLQVLGLVIGDAVCTVGLYDPVLVRQVVLGTSTEQSNTSLPVDLVPGKTYQVAVKFEGAADPGNIAVVRTVSLVP